MRAVYFSAWLLLLTTTGWASEYDPIAPDAESRDEIKIRNLPPVKDQDGIGLCYAFAASTLLEAHQCRVSHGDCRNPSSSPQISPLYMGTLLRGNVRELKVGGESEMLLSELRQNENRRTVRESCAPFDALVQTSQEILNGKTYTETAPQVGWNRIRGYYHSVEKGVGRREPCARAILEVLQPKMKLSLEQVTAALRAPTEEQYLAKLLIPSECKVPQKMPQVPEYELHSFPRSGVPPHQEELAQVLRTQLSAGIPVMINICFESTIKAGRKECKEGHATVVTGIKTVCSGGSCRLAIRLQNSYGQGWQEQFGGGWVDGEQLLKRATEYVEDGGYALSWLTRPGEKIKPAKSVASDAGHDPAPPELPRPHAPAPKPGPPGTLYRCTDEEGSVRFTDQPDAGCVIFRSR